MNEVLARSDTVVNICIPQQGGILPLYDLAAAAHALEVDLKQLDNMLSRNALPGIAKKKRGLARRLTPDVVVVVRLAKEMADALEVSPGSLFNVAQRIAIEDCQELALGPFASLHVDLAALRAATTERLNNAVEAVGRRPRGRPARRISGQRLEP